MKRRKTIEWLLLLVIAVIWVTGPSMFIASDERTGPEAEPLGEPVISAASGTSLAETQPGIGAGEAGQSPAGAQEHGVASESSAAPEPEPEASAGPRASFTLISPTEAIVTNYTQLKEALGNNNGVTTVYFGADITLELTGVRIDPSKEHVVVDGFNPLDPAQQQPYTLTDYSSSVITNTIYINSSAVKSLLVRDLNIVGKNFYGPFSVVDLPELANTLVTYERVNYDGPQIGYHRQGATRFIDCTVRIHGENGGSVRQEFSEVKHLYFEGVNTIETATSLLSIFWHPLGGSFNIADDSSLKLTSPNTSATYGIFYADGPTFEVGLTIGQRSVFDVTISGVVAPTAGVTLSGLTIEEGGAFSLTTTAEAAATVLRMGGPLNVHKDAEFAISSYGGSSYVALRQEGGDITVAENAKFHIIANRAHSSLVNMIGRSFLSYNPSSVLLYNANRDIQATTSQARLYLSAQQVNYWNALSGGTLDEPPLRRWQRPGGANTSIDGTLSVGGGGELTNVSSDYDGGGQAPSASSFSMANARVLAWGRHELMIADVTTRNSSISGVTAPGAAVRVTLNQDGEEHAFADVTADEHGVFHVPVDIPLKQGGVVTARSVWNYLQAMDDTVVIEQGKLEFFVPPVMEFYLTELSSVPVTVERLDPDWMIVISDSRAPGGGWNVSARLESELAPVAPGLPTLAGALVYVNESGQRTVMDTATEIPIQTHVTGQDDEIVALAWESDKGLLVDVAPGEAFADTAYEAQVSWILADVP